MLASSSGDGLVYPQIYPDRSQILPASRFAPSGWSGIVLVFNLGYGERELAANRCLSVVASVVGDGREIDRVS
jgi:hypothetical protein